MREGAGTPATHAHPAPADREGRWNKIAYQQGERSVSQTLLPWMDGFACEPATSESPAPPRWSCTESLKESTPPDELRGHAGISIKVAEPEGGSFWKIAPLEVIARIVRVLTATDIGRLLCVSRIFAQITIEANSGTQVTLAEFLRPRKEHELAFMLLLRARNKVEWNGELEYEGVGRAPSAGGGEEAIAWVNHVWARLLEPALGTLFVMCEAGWPTLRRPKLAALAAGQAVVYDVCSFRSTGAVAERLMYDGIREACTRYLADIVNPQLVHLRGDSLAKALGRRWGHYQVACQAIGSIFMYLDQHCTVRQKLPAVNPRTARGGSHRGGPLALAELVFRDTVLPALQSQLKELQMLACQRDGGDRDWCDWPDLGDLFERLAK